MTSHFYTKASAEVRHAHNNNNNNNKNKNNNNNNNNNNNKLYLSVKVFSYTANGGQYLKHNILLTFSLPRSEI